MGTKTTRVWARDPYTGTWNWNAQKPMAEIPTTREPFHSDAIAACLRAASHEHRLRRAIYSSMVLATLRKSREWAKDLIRRERESNAR